MLTLLLAPFSMLFFQGFSLVSVLYNFFLLPWVSIVTIPLLFLAMFISLIFESIWAENNIVGYLWALVDLSLTPVVFALPFSERFWVTVDDELAALFVFFHFSIGSVTSLLPS